MKKSEQLPRLISLLQHYRWAALATNDNKGKPEASMVAYALDHRHPTLYLHLSHLASHSRNLDHRPDASLVISEPDSGIGDPQQLARVTLSGRVTRLQREEPAYEDAKQCYLQRLPTAVQLFDFADFRLFRFAIDKARFVGGFAQAHNYDSADLEQIWRAISQPGK